MDRPIHTEVRKVPSVETIPDRTAFVSYHRSDAKAFYDRWRQFPVSKFHGDMWPDNFTNSVCATMDKEYLALPEQFYTKSRLPVITPDVVKDFIKHMEMFRHAIIPLMAEVFSGSSGTSSEVHTNQCIALPPVDYRYGWDMHRDDHRHMLYLLIRFFRPKHVLCEFYCRPWSQSGNRADPVELEERRQAERPMLY